MAIIWCTHVSNTNQIITNSQSDLSNIELNVANLMTSTDNQLIQTIAKELTLQTSSFTGLLPAEVTITETGFNNYIWDLHTKKALKLIATMEGASVCIDNSPTPNGSSKYLHWKYDDASARQQLVRYVTNTCRLANKYNINVLLEPLDDGYTNHLNSLQEVIQFIELINMPNLGLSINSQTLINSDLVMDYKKLWRIVINNQDINEPAKLIDKLTTLNKHQQTIFVSMSDNAAPLQIKQLIKQIAMPG